MSRAELLKHSPVMGTLAFHEACQRVIRAAKDAKPDALIQYAASYAKRGMAMRDMREIKVQALYILNNLSAWRGEEARIVKETLKGFTK